MPEIRFAPKLSVAAAASLRNPSTESKATLWQLHGLTFDRVWLQVGRGLWAVEVGAEPDAASYNPLPVCSQGYIKVIQPARYLVLVDKPTDKARSGLKVKLKGLDEGCRSGLKVDDYISTIGVLKQEPAALVNYIAAYAKVCLMRWGTTGVLRPSTADLIRHYCCCCCRCNYYRRLPGGVRVWKRSCGKKSLKTSVRGCIPGCMLQSPDTM